MQHSVPSGFELIDLGGGFAETFGPVYLCRETGTLGFRVAPHHLNPVNVCNGGAMATFADMQIGVVMRGAGTATGHAPTISLSIDYLGTAPLGSWVEAAVEMIKTTRNMVFTQALITANGEIVARSNGIYRHYTHASHANKSTSA
jgi:acyl-coenzyme A thioesterase PaaI-like protein